MIDALLSLAEFEPKWDPLRAALIEFQAALAPCVPKLEISDSIDAPEWKANQGVYLLYTREQLIYVGVTTKEYKNRMRNRP